VILFIGGCLILFGTQERFVRPSEAAFRATGRLLSILDSKGFPAMLALFFVFNVSVNFVAPILPLFIETMCVPGQEGVASTTGLLFAISGAAAAVAAGGIGFLSDRLGYKRILLFHLSLLAAGMLLHGVAQSIFQLALLRVYLWLGVRRHSPHDERPGRSIWSRQAATARPSAWLHP